jgi:hypothetical protein
MIDPSSAQTTSGHQTPDSRRQALDYRQTREIRNPNFEILNKS